MTAEATALTTDADAANVVPVERERITDPVTGLPILRYRFAGPPTLRPGAVAPAGAWRVLRVDERDGRTTLDLETAAGAEPLDRHPAAVDDAVADAALATLRRARACGAVHGDLGPRRLWRRGGELWLEGYGVRWRADPDAASDARELAAGLLDLPGTRLSPAARARLAAVLAAGDVDATADPAPAGAAAAPGSGAAPGAPPVAATAEPVPRLVRGPPPGARVRRGGTGVVALLARDAPRWWTGAAGWAARLRRRLARSPADGPRAAAGGPGDARPGGWRPEVRLRLAAALVVASLAWVALASWSRSPAPLRGPSAAVSGRVIDVTVTPDGQPPVGLVVVASPPGSALAVGSVVASVPGKVWLDLDGRWSFEARFGDRRSPTVDLILPFERALQLAFPSPAAP